MENDPMHTTIDHSIIHEWTRAKHGLPVLVNMHTLTPNKEKIAIAFGGLWQNADVEHISWQEWFFVFEEEKLALKYHNAEPLYELIARDNDAGLISDFINEEGSFVSGIE